MKRFAITRKIFQLSSRKITENKTNTNLPSEMFTCFSVTISDSSSSIITSFISSLLLRPLLFLRSFLFLSFSFNMSRVQPSLTNCCSNIAMSVLACSMHRSASKRVSCTGVVHLKKLPLFNEST